MTSPLPYPIHSIAEAATHMYQGEDPWFALGCFLHDWWRDARDNRQDLIAEPPAPIATPEGRRWAAFCAAVVEELCSKTGFPCPAWTKRQDYVLEHPWFYSSQPSQRSGKTTFSNTPGFILHNHRNVIGYSQQHLRHLNAGTSSLVEVSLTINTSFIRCSARNPDGHRGQSRNYSTSWHQKSPPRRKLFHNARGIALAYILTHMHNVSGRLAGRPQGPVPR